MQGAHKSKGFPIITGKWVSTSCLSGYPIFPLSVIVRNPTQKSDIVSIIIK